MAADEVDFCPHEQFCIILYQLTFLFMDEKFDLMKTWIESLIFPFRLLRIVSWTKYQIAHRSLMDCYSRNVFCSLFCLNIDAKIDWWLCSALCHYISQLMGMWFRGLERKVILNVNCQLQFHLNQEESLTVDIWAVLTCSTSVQIFFSFDSHQGVPPQLSDLITDY